MLNFISSLYKKHCWNVVYVLATLYTIFAIYCFTPWYKDPDAPQIYQMTLVERYDASYQSTGKSKQHVVRYKGIWVEKETGKRKDMVINEYMFFKMPIGETIPMLFKPSQFGVVNHEELTHRLIPILWLVALAFMPIMLFFMFTFGGGPRDEN